MSACHQLWLKSNGALRVHHPGQYAALCTVRALTTSQNVCDRWLNQPLVSSRPSLRRWDLTGRWRRSTWTLSSQLKGTVHFQHGERKYHPSGTNCKRLAVQKPEWEENQSGKQRSCCPCSWCRLTVNSTTERRRNDLWLWFGSDGFLWRCGFGPYGWLCPTYQSITAELQSNLDSNANLSVLKAGKLRLRSRSQTCSW